jgi:hypothetical protein
MRAESGPEVPQRPARETLRWVAATLLLLFLGLPLCLLLMLRLGMSGHGCGAGNVRLTCATAVQLTVIYLPLIGLLLGLGICLVGGLRRRALGGSPGRAVALGWAVFAVFETAAVLLALR